MTSNPSNAYHRILPRRTWWRRGGWAVALWSLVSGLTLCGLLLIATVLVDAASRHGRLTVPPDEVESFVAFLEETNAPGLPTAPAAGESLVMQNSGLLATAWMHRDQVFYRWLLPLTQRMAFLRDNSTALFAVIVVLTLLSLIHVAALARIRARGMRVAVQVSAHLRELLHRQVLRMGTSDLSDQEQQRPLELFTKEVDQVRDGVYAWVTRSARDGVTFLLLTVMLFVLDWRLALQCSVPVAIAWWIYNRGRERGLERRRLAESKAESELRLLAESLKKARLVRGYGMEDFEHERFETHLQRFTRDVAGGLRRQGWSRAGAVAIAILFVFLSVYLVMARGLTPTSPVAISTALFVLGTFALLAPLADSLWGLPAAYEQINRSGERIFRYLAQIPEVGQAVGAKFQEPVSKSIIFESVDYTRNGREILKNFDLRIPAGTVTALVSLDPLAPKAAGYLLPRFIEPTAGRILFDSEDVAWGTLESIRAETILIGGSDPCFTGTALENITCGDPRYSTQAAIDAAKRAHAHNFIQKLSQGYETALGEHGEQLDAGQAFRLSLARAILRNPAVMIIEEPAATLDDDTKALLDDTYNRIARDCTLIFLPSRLSTVRRCDQVALIHDGRIESLGPHAELVNRSDLYRHWEYVTFNTFRHFEPQPTS
ncbi:Putative multidrug export ATP-binding/permease protein [Maioricimonas rarisocia]|uniref:Multidrug export ATP-binding/permease protein n=1 Tax=Maioricimonas rarisocia TaxID=2528026 RepID=A0A517ZEW1_9PLAN|nr:ABC transporter ATP-binding protein [Maioricimonas rarisocia]QDU41008.1 Putative multidrug export ATP-binding/permease protein [Maioricimonas rarisocia]